MADTDSVETHDTSNDAGEDPLQDLNDEQLFHLVEDTLYVWHIYSSISFRYSSDRICLAKVQLNERNRDVINIFLHMIRK